MGRCAWIAPSLIVVAVAVSACGATTKAAPSGNGVAARTATTHYAATAATGAASDTPGAHTGNTTHAAVTSRPTDPLAGTYHPVKRSGPVATHRITATRGTFTKPVTYSDGLRLSVVKVTTAVESAQGAGAFPDTNESVLTLRLINRTTRPVDLENVVTQLAYGHPARIAQAVYDNPAARDFGTVVAPGTSVEGTYAYAVPKNALGALTMHVDLDGLHAVATFTGSGR